MPQKTAFFLHNPYAIYGITLVTVSRSVKEEQTNLKVATLAGGCFWCVTSDFKNVGGVARIISGYIGGQKENSTYKEVSTGKTGQRYCVNSAALQFIPKDDLEKESYGDYLKFFA